MIDQQEKILFEKFEILQCIKKDFHSCVYIANHIYLGKKIFLKTLAKDQISDPAILHRFQREARSLAAINHPNIIQVYDFGNFGNYFYISFEYFPSQDLRSLINEKKISHQHKLELFIQITRGLAEAHQHNIIHRDIKPENILVNADYQVKIADFGLALIKDDINQTCQDSIVGTPGYMSPEQIMGDELTPASDLFSLGIVGYELFCGHNPFLGKDAGATINNILTCDALSSLNSDTGIPEQVKDTLKLLLQKNKSKRPAFAQELLARFQIDDNHSSTTTFIQVERKKSIRHYSVFAIPLILLFLLFAYVFQQKNKLQAIDETALLEEPVITVTDSGMNNNPAMNSFTPVNNESIAGAELLNQQPVSEPLADIPPKQLQPPTNLPGKLFIECLPWADVYINEEKIETTPIDAHINIRAGVHELVLKHPDYPAFTRQLTVKPGEEITVSVNLDTLVGYLFCRVYPWGDVFVDNVFKGQTPLQRPVCLMTGNHLLTLKNDNFESIEEYITITKMDTLMLKFNFEHQEKRMNSAQQ